MYAYYSVNTILIVYYSNSCFFLNYIKRVGDALIEPGEDPEVIRAKYFIRDEFLVSSDIHLQHITLLTHTHIYFLPAYINGKWRWKTLLLSALHMCCRHREHQAGVQ